ncbi:MULTISPECIES: selenide, water dikinase SelD [unclassified Oceanispirochaeta]|uniref:selenide, water dikinase SelD n=1 Tax=unclassified Oceanispirochaeta TaxID=2635722 RepID=UPI000E094D71|nr:MULTISPECIES: selenide, water dikinase SelD [unclassified Oceanispirochaeta]MBF9015300.1 selenide, water dikinase SelD [Oceanispirochaeta sp. M2]NPD71758.1 selenide, water dikinase SelD [Oceanispirochaeta sp. M1]RDG32950.1 selenide, water dikinase SelD [Oceanispirochaeta sp. M1]
MANPEKLTTYSRFSGCGAKLGPELLDKALCGLSQPERPEVLADFTGSEDAGVYRISDDMALVQTVDFFPPIVDDPALFGAIAAANSLSDIYAMGGRPVSAVNVLCYPEDDLPIEYLRKIMEGALEALTEADTALLGGHSVNDKELKFGFSVNGIIHPDRIIRNNSPAPGDVLILTKALGTGTINTALRAEIAADEAVMAAGLSMRALNKAPALLLHKYAANACTDITGFGLAGHGAEMAMDSGTDLIFDIERLPLLPDVMEYISMGLVPAGSYNNRKFRLSRIKNPETVTPEILDLIFDPQTSGGLLISLPKENARAFMEELQQPAAAVIGSVVKGDGRIILNA